MRWLKFLRRRQKDAEMQEELVGYLAAEMEENVARGMPDEEALRQAKIKLGNSQKFREHLWHQNSVAFIETLWQDIRFAVRQIRKSPGFALTAILSLMLGIGATVAVFSVIWDAVVHPWPYLGADRICKIWVVGKTENDSFTPSLTKPEIDVLRQAHSIEDMQTYDWAAATTTAAAIPQDILICHMSGNAFLFLGVRPLFGRYLLPSDSPANGGGQPVALLNFRFWQRYYNLDPSIIGKQIELDQRSYTIVGVMPAGMNWQGADIWLPLNAAADASTNYIPVIHLRKGVTTAAASAELTPLFKQFDRARSQQQKFPPDYHLKVETITEYYVRMLGGTLDTLFGAVLLLLLIGCANLSILLLARGAAREGEFAMRTSLGASRGRIIRQLLTESLMLALTGTALGVLLSFQLVAFIVSRMPEGSFPGEADFHVHIPILVFSAALAIFCGALFGILPAIEYSRPQLAFAMQSGSPKLAGHIRGRRIHVALIAGQVALTLVLLSAAGAAIRGFTRIMMRPLGYDPHRVMSMFIPIARNALPSWTERAVYFQQLLNRVAGMPGIISAAISADATPPSNGDPMPFDTLGRTPLQQQEARVNLVSPEYFRTLNIPMRSGRLWLNSEVMEGAHLAIVNETFARRYFPNEDVTGRSVKFPKLVAQPPDAYAASGSDGWLEIIGIAQDAVDDGLDRPIAPAVYVPYTLMVPNGTQILVRAQGNPLAMLPSIREQIASQNAGQGVWWRVQDLEEWIREEPDYARTQLFSILLGAFAGLALLLAAMGIYSVVSYAVVQRTREFGIRMALGAQRGNVLGLAAGFGALGVMVGIGIGLTASLVFRRIIGQFISGETGDPGIVFVCSAVMMMVTATACAVPALRAASVNPMTALRTE
jgi:putative ABC transport system permease protein